MALIEVEHIVKRYEDESGGTTALADVSFSIEKGEFVAIMGPSGSGKSTLLHILGCLDSSTSGIYTFNGKNINSYKEIEVAKIRNEKMGFVFQAFNLLPRTTVLENVKLPLLYSQVPQSEWDKKALFAIESVGLSHRLTHEPAELSGGEKQRVAIARALINNPDVIYADEPTGNLDSKSGQAVMEVIEKLQREGRTVVLITHETTTAEHAERIIHMKDGKIEREEKIQKRRDARTSYSK